MGIGQDPWASEVPTVIVQSAEDGKKTAGAVVRVEPGRRGCDGRRGGEGPRDMAGRFGNLEVAVDVWEEGFVGWAPEKSRRASACAGRGLRPSPHPNKLAGFYL